MHGGKTPSGPASANYKHGRYSKVLPGKLLDRYNDAQSDDTLLVLADEVRLLDARLQSVLSEVDAGSSAELWVKLKRAWAGMQKASVLGDEDALNQHQFELSQIIARGGQEYAAWSEVYKLLEQRRRLVESERKRMIEMQQMITSEQAMAMLAVITDTIRRHVDDKPTLAAIAADIRKLTVIDTG